MGKVRHESKIKEKPTSIAGYYRVRQIYIPNRWMMEGHFPWPYVCVCVVGGLVGGGWGIAAIRAFTTHLNEWIFRAFRICILMEPVARCSCFSKQKHWQFYWVYFFAPVFTLGQSTRNCCWHFLPCCHWWISAVSQTGGRRPEPIFFFSFFFGPCIQRPFHHFF